MGLISLLPLPTDVRLESFFECRLTLTPQEASRLSDWSMVASLASLVSRKDPNTLVVRGIEDVQLLCPPPLILQFCHSSLLLDLVIINLRHYLVLRDTDQSN